MIIGPKYVFISTPKCGTHTMYWLLKNHYGGKQKKGAYHQKNVPKIHQKKFLFTVTRNPYSRAVSAWTSLLKPGAEDRYRKSWSRYCPASDFTSFMELLANRRPHTAAGAIATIPQYAWIGRNKCRAIKIENLQEEFNELPFVDKFIEIPHLLKRTDESWKEVITDKSLQFIHKWAGKDFKRFGYQKAAKISDL